MIPPFIHLHSSYPSYPLHSSWLDCIYLSHRVSRLYSLCCRLCVFILFEILLKKRNKLEKNIHMENMTVLMDADNVVSKWNDQYTMLKTQNLKIKGVAFFSRLHHFIRGQEDSTSSYQSTTNTIHAITHSLTPTLLPIFVFFFSVFWNALFYS